MRELSIGTNHTAGVKQTVYTVPDKHYVRWNLLYLVNNGATNKTASVWWYDLSTNTEIEILNSVPVSTKTYIKLDGGSYVVLEAGDQIRIQTESGSAITSVCTVELVSARSSTTT
jgi:hypothetical protein